MAERGEETEQAVMLQGRQEDGLEVLRQTRAHHLAVPSNGLRGGQAQTAQSRTVRKFLDLQNLLVERVSKTVF